MESIGHLLLYFLRGDLPWQGLPGKTKPEKYQQIKKKKLEISPEELCKGYPHEFGEYLKYCRGLKYAEEPDYVKCLSLFSECMQRHNLNPKVITFKWKRKASPKKTVKRVNKLSNLIMNLE